MSRSLVIVESAAKAKTIEKFLGSSFRVMASGGHVRDLPSRGLSVDIENGFRPDFEVVPDRSRILAALKAEARKADAIYLATDPDREGEAISHDLAEEFRDDLGARGRDVPIRRITFHEITRPAVRRALEEAGDVDANKVRAQQTRRVLDRIVGYQISPILSKKVAPKLSAGRVQSVALRLICEREREIRAFDIEEYWTIEARLLSRDGKPVLATVDLPSKTAIRDQKTAEAIRDHLSTCGFRVESVESKERRDKAPPPFITSTMQRQAASAFQFPAARTMRAAQSLYEGVDLGSGDREGLITYLRTDSTRVSKEALAEVRAFIAANFEDGSLPEAPNFFRKLKGAQDAHEAIRPTSVARTPEQVAGLLNEDQKRLYRIIWERFVASQMTAAVFEDTKAVISATPSGDADAGDVEGFGPPPRTLSATGSVLVKPGYRTLYREARESGDPESDGDDRRKPMLPPLARGQRLDRDRIRPVRHFTAPPRRYSEAGLIRKMEQNGIGRPSTYVPILRKIKDRDYVRSRNRSFVPTEVGMVVSDLLSGSFDELFNVRYTAEMEEKLDRIEQGGATYEETLRDFYGDFAEVRDQARAGMPRVRGIPTAEPCEQCGKPLVLRWSGGEKFLGCSGFPECRGSRSLSEDPAGSVEGGETDEPCPECGAPLAPKRGKFGPFLGCTRYPDCGTIVQIRDGRAVARAKPEPVGAQCPECGKDLVRRQSRRGPFVGCSGYPKCRYIQPRPGSDRAKSGGSGAGKSKSGAKKKKGPAARKTTAGKSPTRKSRGRKAAARAGGE